MSDRISARARAVAGLWYLEEYESENIPLLVDAAKHGRLKLREPCECVLGWLHRHYVTGRRMLNLSWDDAYLLGFHALYRVAPPVSPYVTKSTDEQEADWDALQQAWEELLKPERQGQHADKT